MSLDMKGGNGVFVQKYPCIREIYLIIRVTVGWLNGAVKWPIHRHEIRFNADGGRSVSTLAQVQIVGFAEEMVTFYHFTPILERYSECYSIIHSQSFQSLSPVWVEPFGVKNQRFSSRITELYEIVKRSHATQ